MAEAPRVIVTSHDGAVVGDLDPARLVDMVVVDEVNGERSLAVTTTQELSKGDRLLWRDGMLRWREYVVEADEAEHSAGEATHAYFCPWSLQYDLSRTFVSAMPGTGGTPATAEQALEAALGGTARWAVGAVDVATTGSASFFRMSGWEALQTLVETWGGEVDATIEVGLAGVTSRSVSLLAHVGDEGATRRFDYGHDVAGIRRTVMDEPWTCRVIPLGKAEETEGGGYGRKVTIEDANGGVMWLEDADAVPLTRVPDGSGGWEHPVQVVENDAMETAADLKAWALGHLHDWTRPKVSYECSVVQLAEAGMDAHGVAVGDECAVVDAAFGEVPIRIETRLLRVEHHPLDRSQDVLTFSNLVDGLGSQLGDIARSVAQVQSQVTSLSLNQSTAEYVSNLIARMNAEANATGGFTYITEGQGIRTYDRAVSDPLVGTEATQVVEVKGGNVRIADSRDSDGDWEWRTVIVSGHVAADLVTAAQITTGYIGSEGGTFIDLDGDTAQLGSSDGFHVVVDSQELGFYQGATRAAYVNGSKLHIPYTVVLNAMQVGEDGGNCWEWRLQDNGNLTLKWIG